MMSASHSCEENGADLSLSPHVKAKKCVGHSLPMQVDSWVQTWLGEDFLNCNQKCDYQHGSCFQWLLVSSSSHKHTPVHAHHVALNKHCFLHWMADNVNNLSLVSCTGMHIIHNWEMVCWSQGLDFGKPVLSIGHCKLN